MLKSIATIMGILAVLSFGLNLGDKIREVGHTALVANTPIRTAVVNKIHEHDPILDYDFTPTVYEIPPRYQAEGSIDPFTPIKARRPKVKKNMVIVPLTALTKWTLPQLGLTCVLLKSKAAFAYFTGPDGGKTYRGEVGDFIGRSGITITRITHGGVRLSNGIVIATR